LSRAPGGFFGRFRCAPEGRRGFPKRVEAISAVVRAETGRAVKAGRRPPGGGSLDGPVRVRQGSWDCEAGHGFAGCALPLWVAARLRFVLQ
jgi:hypothetical protein